MKAVSDPQKTFHPRLKRKILKVFFVLLMCCGVNQYALFWGNIDSNRILIGPPSFGTGSSSISMPYETLHAENKIIAALTVVTRTYSEWLVNHWKNVQADYFELIQINEQQSVLLKKRETGTKYWVQSSLRNVEAHNITILVTETPDLSWHNVMSWKMVTYWDSGLVTQKTPTLIDYTLYLIEEAFEFPPVGG